MKRESLLVLDQSITYRVRVSDRAQRMRIAVYVDGDVVVTKPKGTPMDRIRKFVEFKKLWIYKKLEENTTQPIPELRNTSRKHFLQNEDTALKLVNKKVAHWSRNMGCNYQSVAVKQLKSRWGSCSNKGNLSFNYKILFLPENLQDYVVVHELCHLKQQNHSAKFWNLVGKTLPNYQELSKVIKKV